jgi:hypothetical protein
MAYDYSDGTTEGDLFVWTHAGVARDCQAGALLSRDHRSLADAC